MTNKPKQMTLKGLAEFAKEYQVIITVDQYGCAQAEGTIMSDDQCWENVTIEGVVEMVRKDREGGT
jgi:hypothetical protein